MPVKTLHLQYQAPIFKIKYFLIVNFNFINLYHIFLLNAIYPFILFITLNTISF